MKQDKVQTSLKEVYKFLAENEREIACDINYASELLLTYLNEAVEKIKQRISNATNDDDYEMETLMMSYRKVLNDYRNIIENYLNLSKESINDDICNISSDVIISTNCHYIGEDFKTMQLDSFSIWDKSYNIKNWNDMLIKIYGIFYKKYQNEFIPIINEIKGAKNTITPHCIKTSKYDDKCYKKTKGLNYYVYINLDANVITDKYIRRLFDYFKIDIKELKIYLREK
ncbi:MAG: hypothetical protein NC548_56785 [Lachnospiraceae bacterium]|nr:hypothetical protein [Lachnospiraceae bacterium]